MEGEQEVRAKPSVLVSTISIESSITLVGFGWANPILSKYVAQNMEFMVFRARRHMLGWVWKESRGCKIWFPGLSVRHPYPSHPSIPRRLARRWQEAVFGCSTASVPEIISDDRLAWIHSSEIRNQKPEIRKHFLNTAAPLFQKFFTLLPKIYIWRQSCLDPQVLSATYKVQNFQIKMHF